MKESFLLYISFYEPIKNLSKEDKGELLDAIFNYQINPNNPVGLQGSNVKMAFEFFKNQFRLDNVKYQKTVDKNRENGKKGGRPSLKNKNPNNPVGLKKPKKADNDNVNDNEKENDNEEDLVENKKIPNRLNLSKGMIIAFAKEFKGLTTTEIEEQRIKCNAYMNMSSENYNNPGLFFRAWLKKYLHEKQVKANEETAKNQTINSLPDITEEQRQKNIQHLDEMRKSLKMGVIK